MPYSSFTLGFNLQSKKIYYKLYKDYLTFLSLMDLSISLSNKESEHQQDNLYPFFNQKIKIGGNMLKSTNSISMEQPMQMQSNPMASPQPSTYATMRMGQAQAMGMGGMLLSNGHVPPHMPPMSHFPPMGAMGHMVNSANFQLRQQQQQHMQQSMNMMGGPKVNAARRRKKAPNMIQSARLGMIGVVGMSTRLPLFKNEEIAQIKGELEKLPMFWWINDQKHQGIFKFQEFILQRFEAGQKILQNYSFVQRCKLFCIKSGEIEIVQKEKSKVLKAGAVVDLERLIQEEKGSLVVASETTKMAIYDKAAVSGFLKQVSLINFNNIRDTLKRVKIFNGMPKLILEHLAFEFKIVQFPGGSTIISENQPNDQFYVLLEGSIGFYRKGTLYKMITQGQFVGENMLSNSPDTFSCVCEGQCQMLQISRQQISERKSVFNEMKRFAFYNQIELIMEQDPMLSSIDFQSLEFQQISQQHYGLNQLVVPANINDIVIVVEGSLSVQSHQGLSTLQAGEVFSNYFESGSRPSKEFVPRQLVCHSHICKVAFLPIEVYLSYQDNPNMLSQVDEQLSVSSTEADLKNLTPDLITFKRIIAESAYSLVLEVEIKQRRYVCKTISKGTIQQFELENQLTHERALYNRLSSAFSPRVYSTFQDEKHIFILMDLFEGTNLDEHLENNRPELLIQQLTNYVVAMGKVINQVHMRAMLHRDIKLSNFMVDSQDKLKIIDFGFGKLVNEQDKMFTRLGTPHYMSPELICGQGYSYDVDCWAFGVCIFETLFGYLPWGEFMEDPFEINKSILSEPLQIPDSASETFPQTLTELVHKLLDKDLSSRLCCMDEVMKDSFFSAQPLPRPNDHPELHQDMLNSAPLNFHPGTLSLASFLRQNQRQEYDHDLADIPGWDGHF